VTDDEKYLVGITLLEYLTPLFNDPYIIEGCFLELLLQHLQPTHLRPLLQVLKLSFTDFSSYVPRLFTAIVRRIQPLKSDTAFGNTNPELNFLLVLV
jgi:hypothetical protein